jgi:hypothetical protein
MGSRRREGLGEGTAVEEGRAWEKGRSEEKIPRRTELQLQLQSWEGENRQTPNT